MNLLDIQNDFDLCDRVFCELSEKAINVINCSELERVVRLVWDSAGLMGNGGLHRLFEGNYPGDPGYLHTIDSYNKIGAQRAFNALQSAFRLFPGGLPLEIQERLQQYESIPNQLWEEIESRFYKAEKEIEHCLADFIRNNHIEYERLIEDRKAEQQTPPDAQETRAGEF